MPPLFLIGFMAAGKSSVGAALAAATGRRFVDLDDVIAAMGEPVAQLVARDEPEFRRREAHAVAKMCDPESAVFSRTINRDAQRTGELVIATGGGAAAFGDNLARMRAAGLVVALGVDVDEATRRAAGGPERPLLANAVQLAAKRASIYRGAHAVIDTMGRTIAEVVEQVRHVERVYAGLPARYRHSTILALGERSYPILVDDVIEPQTIASAVPGATKLVAITDSNVAKHHLALLPPGTDVVAIEPGEASKTFATYERLCSELVARGLDRGSAIVALGGGVVGDLAGFVAATLFRGIPVVQVPTTIVAMTDAAIGGKTAVDLPAGKNLVGAFWQPRMVACATRTLSTLPARERRAGFGELWKYALLDGPELWRLVSACAPRAADEHAGVAPPHELRAVIDRCVAYKAAIVSRDERERTGHRALLNLGHTVGHAIESASGMLHGEAVALGLLAAVRVSAAVVGTRASLETELARALEASGLSADLDRWITDDVLGRITVDKKRIGANLRFIAIRDVGSCEPVEIPVTELSRILRPVARG